MAASIPNIEPERLTQGDTWQWTTEVPDYPATDGWALSYDFTTPDGAVQVALAAVQNGTGADYLATITAAKAAEFTAVGTYRWRAKVVLGAETVTVRRGRLELLDALTGATDRRLWLEKMVAALEAKLEDRATKQQLGYSVEGRSLSLIPLSEAMDIRDRLKAELEAAIRAEDLQNGYQRRSGVRVRLWG